MRASMPTPIARPRGELAGAPAGPGVLMMVAVTVAVTVAVLVAVGTGVLQIGLQFAAALHPAKSPTAQT